LDDLNLFAAMGAATDNITHISSLRSTQVVKIDVFVLCNKPNPATKSNKVEIPYTMEAFLLPSVKNKIVKEEIMKNKKEICKIL